MTRIRFMLLAVALGVTLAPAPRPAVAGDTGAKIGGTVEESAKTGAFAVRDGAKTFGRTVRDFFKGGTSAARETWRENEEITKENAREGADKVREAADD